MDVVGVCRSSSVLFIFLVKKNEVWISTILSGINFGGGYYLCFRYYFQMAVLLLEFGITNFSCNTARRV